MNNYTAQYKHPNWQKVRLEVLQRDKYTCTECGDTETQLHVHHKSYKYGKKIWDYPLDNFITLCESCHETRHEEAKCVKEHIKEISELLTNSGSLLSEGILSLTYLGSKNGSLMLNISTIFQSDYADEFFYEIQKIKKKISMDSEVKRLRSDIVSLASKAGINISKF